MDKQQTINIINSNVKQNGREEITGPVLNNVLLAMVEYSSEAVPVQDLGPIEEELDDHERRITSNTDNITNVNNRIDRLDETKVRIVGLFPAIDNPVYQSDWNRRVYNYIINGTANENALKKDQLNVITSNFSMENTSANWKFTQVNNNPMIDVRGHKTTFRGALGFEVNPENKVEVAPSYIRGLNNNMEWTITKRGDNTLPSMLYLPQGETLQTLATSVNGIKADINGNVTLESVDPYQLPIATSSRLGGVRVGTGLTIGFDGVLSATPLNYELPTATSTVKGGIRIGNGLTSNIQGVTSLLPATPFIIGGVRPDNSTITVDENGTLTVIGGGSGGGYVLPTATTTRLGGIIVGSGLTINASGVLSATGGSGGSFNPNGANTVTNAFSLTSPTWSIKSDYAGDDSNVLTFDVGVGTRVSFNKSTGIRFDDSARDRAMYIEPSGISLQQDSENGLYIGLSSMITNKGEYSYPTQSGTMVMSVNGVKADATGNIVVSGGGATYTGSNGIQISGSNVITPQYGTTSNTVAQGNDSRFPTTAEKTSWNNKLDKPTANAELASVVGFDAGGVSKKSEVVEIASSWTSGTAPTSTQLTDAFPNAMFVMAVNLTVPKMYIKSGGGWKSVNLETVV